MLEGGEICISVTFVVTTNVFEGVLLQLILPPPIPLELLLLVP